MPRSLFLAAALLALASPALAQGYRTVPVVDQNGFERPLTAYTIDIPQGWRMSGGVYWDMRDPCQQTARKSTVEVVSPDGAQTLRGYPTEMWSWGSVWEQSGTAPGTRAQSGCILAPPSDAMGYLRWAVQNLRPGAQVVSARPLPALQQLAQRKAQGQAQMSAAEVVVEYEANGARMREVFHTAVGNQRQPALDMYGGMSGYLTVTFTTGIAALAGPASGFDTSPLTRMWQSAEPNPQYEQRMAQHYQQMGRIAARGAQDRARTNARSQAEINRTLNETSDIIAGGYADRSGMNDAGHAYGIDGVREVNAYQDQYGERVEMGAWTDRAYEMGDGSYVGTNDPSYEPAWGKQMQPYDYGAE